MEEITERRASSFVLLTKHYLGHQIKEYEISRARTRWGATT